LTKKNHEVTQKQEKEVKEQVDTAQKAGAMIGQQMGEMISGQQSFAQSMGNITSK